MTSKAKAAAQITRTGRGRDDSDDLVAQDHCTIGLMRWSTPMDGAVVLLPPQRASSVHAQDALNGLYA